MNIKPTGFPRIPLLLSSLCCLLVASPSALAQDSVRASTNASAASAASALLVPVAAASVVVLTAHAGAVMIVESVRAVGKGVEVVLKGSAHVGRAVIVVSAAAVGGMALSAGQAVKVAAEGGGYLLTTGTQVICFVPASGEPSLLHSRRSS